MYFVALEGVTRYALSEAIKAVVRGKLGHTFFPSPIEFRQLCDKAQQPHIDQAHRIRVTESNFAERRRMEMVHAGKTPEAKARVVAIYAKFCEGYRSVEPEFVPTLDPELVAKVHDAPSTFTKAKVA